MKAVEADQFLDTVDYLGDRIAVGLPAYPSIPTALIGATFSHDIAIASIILGVPENTSQGNRRRKKTRPNQQISR